MATIQLTRKKEFQASSRKYQVFINDEILGTISNNETKKFTVVPKRYRMVVKLDWCSSPIISFNLAEGETKCIQVEGILHKGLWYKICLCFIFLEFIYVAVRETDFSGLSVIPLLLYYLYFFTLGRNKYLTVTVVN